MTRQTGSGTVPTIKYLKAQQAKTEQARINRDLRRLRTQVAALEARRQS